MITNFDTKCLVPISEFRLWDTCLYEQREADICISQNAFHGMLSPELSEQEWIIPIWGEGGSGLWGAVVGQIS